MKPYHSLQYLRGRLAAFLFLLGCTGSIAAAQATGTLAGRVSDTATGKSLQGAVVKVLGTTAIAYTDADGRFSLPHVPAGAHRIEVDYVGLDPYLRDVLIPPGRVATFNASLESKALQLEAFTVAESVRGQALAINQKKSRQRAGQHRFGGDVQPQSEWKYWIHPPTVARPERERGRGRRTFGGEHPWTRGEIQCGCGRTSRRRIRTAPPVPRYVPRISR